MARRLVDSRNAIARIPTKPISAEKRSIHCSRRCRIFDETDWCAALCGIVSSVGSAVSQLRGLAVLSLNSGAQSSSLGARHAGRDESTARLRNRETAQPHQQPLYSAV